MKNRKFHQFILLLTASIAIGCTKHQETNNDDVSENKYEIAEWDNVPVNLVSKEKFFIELEEDVIFPDKGKYKFDSCQNGLISGTVTAEVTPEGIIEGGEVESKVPRRLAVQIKLDKIPYTSSESKISLDSNDESTNINFIALEWDTATANKTTADIIIFGDMDQKAMMSNGDISCNITLLLKLNDGELLKLHFTELTPGTPPGSMN